MIILIIKMTLCVVIPGSLECALHIHECCDVGMCNIEEPADLGGEGFRMGVHIKTMHPFK